MILFDRRTHGFFDYITSVILITSPWLVGFYYEGMESWSPILIGLSSIFLGVLTDFELGLLRIIPMKYHLGIDVLFGIILIISPWIFNFSNFVYLPHVFLGLLLIILALITDPVAIYKRKMAP